MSIYNGFWFFGETGYIGRSFLSNYRVKESKTWFTIPSWVPYLGYASFGLVRHVPNDNPYKLFSVATIMAHFDVFLTTYNDSLEVVEKNQLHNTKDVNNESFNVDCSTIISVQHNGSYVGDMQWAYNLLKLGIHNPLSDGGDCPTCYYGKSIKDGKWYGWSHRAMFGFMVGSKIKKGDCGYVSDNPKEIMDGLHNENKGHLGFHDCPDQ